METIFKHKEESLHAALGISDARSKELGEIVKNAFLNTGKVSETFEEVLKEGLSVIETMYAGSIIGQIKQAEKNHVEQLAGGKIITPDGEYDLSGEEAREILELLKKHIK